MTTLTPGAVDIRKCVALDRDGGLVSPVPAAAAASAPERAPGLPDPKPLSLEDTA